ncbi:hypothetical protein B0T14DRAFT_570391 [Immersiella caudata]|uniref:DUF7580 domain-containing protein n=1 Tax=Immersiella caudata TaxID=314043 RepID=A0AA39WFI0_9PEZI|nr:hypothetical protein B0T14DRAFT_570391 [Immersiella caudata]
MSGFEIAGIVLGAFPVAISALQGYRRAAEMIDCWHEIRREHSKCSHEIQFHQLRYTCTVKRLLLPLVVDDDTIARLVADPRGEFWKAPFIADALEKRLQDSYTLYFETITEIRRTIDELNEELIRNMELFTDAQATANRVSSSRSSTPPPSESKPTSASRFRQRFKKPLELQNRFKKALKTGAESAQLRGQEFASRARFIMRETDRTRIFGELHLGNDRLEKLLQMNDHLSALQTARQKATANATASATALVDFWRHADRLYTTLSRSWGCSCVHSHCARLALEHRTNSEKEFRLLVSYGPAIPTAVTGSSGKWKLCSLKIKAQSAEKLQPVERVREALPPASIPSSDPQHRTAVPSKPALRGGNRSRPDQKQRAQGQLVPIITVTLALPNGRLPDIDNEGRIPDLCSRLSHLDTSSTESTGFLDATDTRYYVYPEQSMVPGTSGPVATLAQFLSQNPPARLSRKQRYNVALDIASSFVQLMATPWIDRSLNKGAIEFCQKAGGAQLGPPLVARRFEPQEKEEQEDLATQPGGINTAAINALGVLLLELCFGRPIERHAFRESLGGGVANANPEVAATFDLMAALQWQAEVIGEAGSDYSEAVEWCLRGCHMAASDTSSSWRKEMLQKVVIPLERCNSCF